ncbi:MAG: 2-succinyl-6-hydroxy-2,4-cyclohexadiene-1-carboxylate synthase [Myxococcota bacterium]
MKLPVARWGSGPVPALLLHGFTGGRDSFRHLEPLLGDLLTATCVELPGHGEAPLPSSEAEGFAQTVEALTQLLERPTVVIGYSMGARLALALAIRSPARVQRLVLESGTAGLRQRHARTLRRRADEALAQALLTEGVEAFVDRWEALPLFAGVRASSQVDHRALRARRTSHHAAGLAGALRSLGQGVQPDLWPALPKLFVPTLILSGANDVKYSRLARRLAEELPVSWRVSFPGVGHAPHLEAARAWADEVRRFLDAPWREEPAELPPESSVGPREAPASVEACA